ncbi:olfactomedin-like protein 3A isoform X1 [Megalops cyprinoides]|uniref:olfactomedin-like protein 3A isoform X1 n=1 Tax=Megalops cyprinoides TaxID=118141 RepID=UPI001864F582|nr:olfactomedin-like protein 3A isoform X1 [Megalops cyprinoides]
MYNWCSLLAAFLLTQRMGYAQRQEMVMMQYFEGRMNQLEDRLAKCDQDMQNYEQKLYDLSKEVRGRLEALNVFKAEVKSQVESAVMRVERVERELEYLETEGPKQPCVEIDETLLEQQVKEEQQKKKVQINLGTDCNMALSAVKSLKIVKRAGDANGSWLKDPSKGSGKVYFFSGSKNSTFLEFTSMKNFTEGNFSQAARRIQLPFPWQGTGHAVYNGFLYYHRADTANEILKVHIHNLTVNDRTLLQGAGRMPAYSLSPHTFIDLAVDELGLWAIHADSDFGGNLVLTKLDKSSLGVEHTWDTPCKSRDAEGAFVICGTLYVVYNSRYGGRSTVQCLYDVYDTIHSEDTPLLFFPKRYATHSSMHYHPKEKLLYSWDEGYQTVYKLETKKKNKVPSI